MRRFISSLLSFALIGYGFPVYALPAVHAEALSLTLSPSLGFVAEHFQGTSGRKVILIQDLHAHLNTQQKIIGLLHFYESHGFLQRPIGIEGAAGSWDLTKLAQFPNPARGQQLNDYLLKEAGLTGPEWFALKTNRPTLLTGIDSESDVLIQRQVFSKTLSRRELAAEQMDDVFAALKALESKQFKGNLKRWLHLAQDFETGKIYADQYLHKLVSVGHRIGVDPEAETLHKALIARTSQDISELSIQDQFYTDLRQYSQAIGIRLARSPSQTNLIKAHFAADLLHRLFRQQLTLSEIQLLSVHQEELALLTKDIIQGAGDKSWFDEKSLLELVRASTDFYVAALVRDEPLASNILDLLDKPRSIVPSSPASDEAVIAVVGGFHTRGITQALKQKAISYDVIAPNITAAYTRADQKRYADRLAGVPVSLEGLFSEISQAGSAEPSEIASPQSRTLNALLTVPEKIYGRDQHRKALPPQTRSMHGPEIANWFDSLRQSLVDIERSEPPTYQETFAAIGLPKFETVDLRSIIRSNPSHIADPIIRALTELRNRFTSATWPFYRVVRVNIFQEEITPEMVAELSEKFKHSFSLDKLGSQLIIREDLGEGKYAVWTSRGAWELAMPYLEGPASTEESRWLTVGALLAHEHLEDHYDTRLSQDTLTHDWLVAHGATFDAVASNLAHKTRSTFFEYMTELLGPTYAEYTFNIGGLRFQSSIPFDSSYINGVTAGVFLENPHTQQGLVIRRINKDSKTYLLLGNRTYLVPDTSVVINFDAILSQPLLWLGNSELVNLVGIDKLAVASENPMPTQIAEFAANFHLQHDLLPPPVGPKVLESARQDMATLESTLILMDQLDEPLLSRAQQLLLMHQIAIVGEQTGPHPGVYNQIESDTENFYAAIDMLQLFRGSPHNRLNRLDPQVKTLLAQLKDYLYMVQFGVEYERLDAFGEKLKTLQEMAQFPTMEEISQMPTGQAHINRLRLQKFTQVLGISRDKVAAILSLAKQKILPTTSINFYYLQPEIPGKGNAVKMQLLPPPTEIPHRPIRKPDDILSLPVPIVHVEDLQIPAEPNEDLAASIVPVIMSGGAATRFGSIPKPSYRVIKIVRKDGGEPIYLTFLQAKLALSEGLSPTGKIAQWIPTSFVAERTVRQLFSDRSWPLGEGSFIPRQEVSWRFVPGTTDRLLYEGERISLSPGIGHGSNIFQILLHPEMLLDALERGHLLLPIGQIDNLAQLPRANIARLMLKAAQEGKPLTAVLEIAPLVQGDKGGIPALVTYQKGVRQVVNIDLREQPEYEKVPSTDEHVVDFANNRYFNPNTPWVYTPALLVPLGILEPRELEAPAEQVRTLAIARLKKYVGNYEEIVRRARAVMAQVATYVTAGKKPIDEETGEQYIGDLPEQMMQNFVTRLLPGRQIFVIGPRSGPDNIFTPTKDQGEVVAQQRAWAEIFNSRKDHVRIDGVSLDEIGEVVPMDRHEIEVVNKSQEHEANVSTFLKSVEPVTKLREAYTLQKTPEMRRQILRDLHALMFSDDPATRETARSAASRIVTNNAYDIQQMLAREDKAPQVRDLYRSPKTSPEVKSMIWAIVQSALKKGRPESNTFKAALWLNQELVPPAEEVSRRLQTSDAPQSRRWAAVMMGGIGIGVLLSVASMTSLSILPMMLASLWVIPQIEKFLGYGNATFNHGVIQEAFSHYQRLHEPLHLFLNGGFFHEVVMEFVLTPLMFWIDVADTAIAFVQGTVQSLFNLGSGEVDARMAMRVQAMEEFFKTGTAHIPDLTRFAFDKGTHALSYPSAVFMSYLETLHEKRRLEAYERARQQLDFLKAA